MKVTIIDKNNMEAYVALDDGSIASIPLNQVPNSNIGDTICVSTVNTICSPNPQNSSSMVVNKLIDFF
ncbi:hypothetical protein NNC19_06540 [Clostridium sp. SHJSY1]|uniref:hypothetical protein n=1 Tax=Clostridium sp. SHJSY1 TaxID=2942483 RepID=UPI0028754812|nr:hypothetical protein [Clostridium sp. SHJSY1]MDS0525330.1 hypothetical protein [Clostridium sp. SHJSY1]